MLNPTQEHAVALALRKINVVVTAGPGTGKTHLLKAVAQRLQNKSVLVTSFTKRTTVELEVALGGLPFVKVATVNAVGMRILSKSHKAIDLDETKYAKLLRKQGVFENQKLNELALAIFNYARANAWLTIGQDELDYIQNVYGLDIQPIGGAALPVVNGLLAISQSSLTQAKVVIDFDDQVYLPGILGLVSETYDYVLVDESQDLSISQFNLLADIAKNIVFVGDDRQQIYIWRGGLPNALGYFAESLMEVETVYLPQTYRFGKTIAQFVNETVYPTDQSKWLVGCNADDGTIDHLETLPIAEVKVGDMVIARKNAPIMAAAIRLYTNGTPVFVSSKGLKRILETHINDLQYGSTPCPVCGKTMVLRSYTKWGKTNYFLSCPTYVKGSRDNHPAIFDTDYGGDIISTTDFDVYCQSLEIDDKEFSLEDVKQTLKLLLTNDDGELSLSLAKDRVQSMFNETGQGSKVILTTIHSGKGLQAPTVYVLGYNSISTPRKTEGEIGYEIDKLSAINALYVALTRAQTRLVLVRS